MNRETDRHSESGFSCPVCDSKVVTSELVEQQFDYGEGDALVHLSCTVPSRTCTDCGFQFLDKEAEVGRHAAVCSHLGVLSPGEIKSLRNDLGLSRAELAELTGLGDASIARWESGNVIQNIANDRYLRLLRNRHNVPLLRAMQSRTDNPGVQASPPAQRFPALHITPSVIQQQDAFKIRATG